MKRRYCLEDKAKSLVFDDSNINKKEKKKQQQNSVVMEATDLNSVIITTDFFAPLAGGEDEMWSLRVVEQKLFPAKAKQRRLPFSIVKAGEKKGLEVAVRVEPDRVDPPECRLTDQDGNEVPWIKGSSAPSVKRRSSDIFAYEFQLGSESGIFRIKFFTAPASDEETRSNCLSYRFAVIRNTGKDRPEMKHAFCSLLWLSFRDQVLLLAFQWQKPLLVMASHACVSSTTRSSPRFGGCPRPSMCGWVSGCCGPPRTLAGSWRRPRTSVLRSTHWSSDHLCSTGSQLSGGRSRVELCHGGHLRWSD